jgi:hypothetical protein
MNLRTPCPFPLLAAHHDTPSSTSSQTSPHHDTRSNFSQNSPSCTQAGSSNFAPPTRSPIEHLGSSLYRQSAELKSPPGGRRRSSHFYFLQGLSPRILSQRPRDYYPNNGNRRFQINTLVCADGHFVIGYKAVKCVSRPLVYMYIVDANC